MKVKNLLIRVAFKQLLLYKYASGDFVRTQIKAAYIRQFSKLNKNENL